LLKPKTFVISYILYPFDVLVSTDTQENIVRRLRRICDLDDEEIAALEMAPTCQGRCVMLKSGGVVIRLRYEPNTPVRTSNLVHEVFHAVHMLFDRIGIRLSDDSDEAFAYAIQYLTREILERFKQKK
jgi:hypothetical protein